MPNYLGSDYWLARATEAKTEAESATDANTKRLLLSVAENYTALARIAAELRSGTPG
jgi:hypothetical protein